MDSVLLKVRYGNVSAVIKVGSNQCFDEVVSAIRLKLIIGMSDFVCLTYSLPSAENCILENNEDLANMFCVAEVDNKRVVDLNVCMTRQPSSNAIANMDGTDFSSALSLSGSHINAVTEAFTSINDAPLLSMPWAFGLKDIGQRFPGCHVEFKATLIKYAAEKGFEFCYIKNNKQVVSASCVYKTSGCNWFVRAAYNKGFEAFELKSFTNQHDCDFRLNKAGTSKRMSQEMVAEVIKTKLRDEHICWKSKDVRSHMKDQYAYDMPYLKAWRSLRLAKTVVFGEENDSYSRLNWYIRGAKALNPGSLIDLELSSDDRRFQRLFVAWGGCVAGYRHVRPLISLDATFLTGTYLGTLMVATAKTGNQELFPIAYGIAYGETTDNWHWFLSHLSKIVDHDRRPISFFSDRNPGLLNALPRVFPTSSHYYCLYHLKENLRTSFGGGTPRLFREYIVSLFQQVAYASNMPQYSKAKKTFLEKGGTRAKEFLKGLDGSHWAHVYSRVCRYGETTSSASESFNSAIRLEKNLPIDQFIDVIRERLMKWFNKHKKESDGWQGMLTKKMDDILECLVQEGRRWSLTQVDTNIFEVFSHEIYVVDLDKKTCSCSRWPLKGFPCAHVIKCIGSTNFNMSDFIEDYWFIERYKQAFAVPIIPIPTSMREYYSLKEDLPILPPIATRQAGRPPEKRKIGSGERQDVRQMVCTKCEKLGNHNKRSCTFVRPSPEA